MPGLLGTSLTPDELWDTIKSVGRGINLGSTSGLLGGPVDMATMLLNNPGMIHPGLLGAQGLGIENPVGGSKWIEQSLQPAGLLPKRQGNWQEGVGEAASALINPMTAAYAAGPKLYAMESQIVENAMKPTTANKQAGMIRLPQGRIPETKSEIDKLSDSLRGRAEAAGYTVNIDKSSVSPSRYVNIDKYPNGDTSLQQELSAQIRLSNHNDFNRGMAGGVDRFSVDPASMNTYEEAIKWLADKGLPVAPRSASRPRVKFSGFTPEDKAISQYMERAYGASPGMTTDQLRQVYGDGAVERVRQKILK